ncbi:MAG: hypothetical protein SH817_10550 [Leptospira sp.]|nr:hypothetical protein [Leptospira sp.]
MPSLILIFTGSILFLVGIFIYVMALGSHITIKTNLSISLAKQILQYGVPGLLISLGVIFNLMGIFGIIRRAKTAKQNAFIMQNGLETDANVLFVDRNYLVRVNYQWIYSILEYEYKDALGNTHLRRIKDVPTEWVIRNKIEVGGKLKIKYLREDPKQSVVIV